ncbi:MAG: hypothetical protein HY852_00400 [Bradyrhizobium sp.]|uniref:hypothetical protein n=1 Tax=Bradyrhizobium sp. TaxID=376 RepID=UPI0025C38F7B|nr:hypothetical protein [Bradyrhizobium sp.]MBI5260261.1 hypothetical protein [Bradyrhizobium sp.]
MTEREFEAFCREYGASRAQARAMASGLARSRAELPKDENPFDGPETSAAIARMFAVVSKKEREREQH